MVVLLEVAEGETLPPREVFTMLQVGHLILNCDWSAVSQYCAVIGLLLTILRCDWSAVSQY